MSGCLELGDCIAGEKCLVRLPRQPGFPFSLLPGGLGYAESIASGVLHTWTWDSLCLDFTLFPREVRVLTWGKSGSKATLHFSPLSLIKFKFNFSSGSA